MANCSGFGGEWHAAECVYAMWYVNGLRLADRFASVIYRQYLCDRGRHVASLVPRLLVGGKKKSLVSTVRACA